MPWYYANNDQRLGPVSESEFARLVREKIIRDDTLVWRHGMADWKRYAEVAPTLPPPEIPPAESATASSWEAAPAAATGKSDLEIIRDILPPKLNYAGFWMRVLAKCMDSFVLSVVVMIISDAMGLRPDFPAMHSLAEVFRFLNQMSAEQLTQYLEQMRAVGRIALIVGLAYNWFFLWRFSATPGKLVLGIKVVRSDGSRLSHGRIVARYFAEMLNQFIMFVGYLTAAFDREKRAMHDFICDTRVVKKTKE
jgi:uncharacterized RDD family membrane protein YckC